MKTTELSREPFFAKWHPPTRPFLSVDVSQLWPAPSLLCVSLSLGALPIPTHLKGHGLSRWDSCCLAEREDVSVHWEASHVAS